jgi:aminoglycoside 6'-N-acetyltransferase I
LIVRPVTAGDYRQWAAMRQKLWPDEDPDELESELAGMFELDPPYTVFVADDGGTIHGFIELWVRSFAEGAPPGPTAYVEGLWVEPGHRRQGVASALVGKAEEWARGKGFSWLGSDAVIDNDQSHAWHRAAGFAEVERLVVFGKRL